MAKVVIIGAGLMGSAMSWPLSGNGHEVCLVGTHLDDEVIDRCKSQRLHPRLNRELPGTVIPFFFHDVDQALDGADLIISGVSSPGVDWIAEVLSGRIRAGQQILSITKGIRIDDRGKVRLFPDIIAESFPLNVRNTVIPVAVGGPCIAGELAAGRQTCVMFGSRDIEAARSSARLLSTSYYHPRITEDLLSVELGVAMKNAYTVAVGIAYGMHAPDAAGANTHNTAAALFAQGCHEIGGLLRLTGGDERMASALPGAGDLYVTSAAGRTMTLGKMLGGGKTYAQAEAALRGVTLESVQIIREMGKALSIWESEGSIRSRSFPLLRMLVDIVVNGGKVEIPFEDFYKDV
jgi:glycerol-3-phosphate dehydrogenase (NAD(P)+)